MVGAAGRSGYARSANPTYPTNNESTGTIQYPPPLQQIFAAPQYPPKDKQILAA